MGNVPPKDYDDSVHAKFENVQPLALETTGQTNLTAGTPKDCGREYLVTIPVGKCVVPPPRADVDSAFDSVPR